jgi:acyl-CoA thioester hydrolase
VKLDIPEKKLLTHESLIPIRWGDMDAMGHVNNTVYFRYLEIVRLDWFEAIDVRPDPLGEGPVIVNAFCTFHRQLEYPGQVLARHYVGEAGRTSFDTYVTLERTDEPGVVYASGGATVVWINFPEQRSAPLPAKLRTLLGATPS